MDIITQLQEQLSEIAMVAVNTFGTLQRDAPPDRLSSSYPDPLNPNPKPEEDAKPQVPAQPAAAAARARPRRAPQGHEPRPHTRRQEGLLKANYSHEWMMMKVET
ncbi:mediator of RNA polymerase II transcription subunit 21 [Panicum miliaceum]|uniref:Mediator of RNA polymerase II transcription subunit 21 n=1 Tax=Panicum miliaceum TaxID=4540 RepID=A0A3L6PUB2_PANMI|nr:mediator of RNA polymerase II transcription subunit 21 [Panicum miliaceum]